MCSLMGFRCFWFLAFTLASAFWNVVLSDQDGFLSLSCGETTSFFDSSNISWIPDTTYVSTGNTSTINTNTDNFTSLRFFPYSQARKCYTLPVKNVATLVLVRAQFAYKNYDGLNKPPTFSISLGTAITSTINLKTSDPWIEEFIWPVTNDILLVCLHAIPNGGSPVISSLEVRPVPRGAYKSGFRNFPNKSLRKCYRINCGYTNGSLRYPLDQYDRMWDADRNFTPSHLATAFNIQRRFARSTLREIPPMAVLQTARVLARGNVLTYNFPLDKLGDYYIVLYFAGILTKSPSLDIVINGVIARSNYIIKSSEVTSLFFMRKGIESLNITFRSISFHPQINAIEVYEIVDIPQECSSTTVSALEVIQKFSGLDFGWRDDPCSPIPWNHIKCNGNTVIALELSDINLRTICPTLGDLLELKTLDLHNTSLVGQIQNLDGLQNLEKLNLSFNQLTDFGSDIESLVNLQFLDLQSNSIKGMVPESFGKLKNLRLLNLENNNLQGMLPRSLNKESLEVRTSGNKCLSLAASSCNDLSVSSSFETPQVTIFSRKKQSGHIRKPLILGAVGAIVSALVLISVLVFLYQKKRKSDITYTSSTDMRNWTAARVFTYKEIKVATNKFRDIIGRGSFGSVYLGKLANGKQVAVKVRCDQSRLGAESFVNEVNLLSKVHHQNLVTLEGFCHEAKRQILVYEYVPGGSLADGLYGTNGKKVTLSWLRRLKISVDAAKGLDYLHNGSDPRIIHRDVKCSNILLDMDMNARVCDFGLSKQVTQADATHVTTVVKGTAGYIDPEYYSTQQLTEKSDVYSFGVVLLELICGREPLTHCGTPDTFNLVLWAKPYLQAGTFDIVDECLKGSFDEESMRKTASVASMCVERDASMRPTIAHVLAELKEAYSIQLSYLAISGHVD